MKSFLVRYGVRGSYVSSGEEPRHLTFTDVVHTAHEWPSLREIFARAKVMHHPGYRLLELTHVYEVREC